MSVPQPSHTQRVSDVEIARLACQDTHGASFDFLRYRGWLSTFAFFYIDIGFMFSIAWWHTQSH
jgi:hypothetical protein